MKKLKMILTIVFLFLIGINLTSCNDDKCDDCVSICDSSNTIFLPQEVKDYFCFKEGSYWVYKDSISGVFDSIWIKNAVIEIGNQPSMKKNCNEVYSCVFSSLEYGGWICQIESVGPKVVNDIFNFKFLNTNNGLLVYRFEYKDNAFIVNTAEGGVVSKMDSIDINGAVYKNILYLNYPNPVQRTEYYKTAYYSPLVGLVKCITQDGKVWELIDYKVSQENL